MAERAKLIVPKAAQPTDLVDVPLVEPRPRFISRIFTSAYGMLALIPGLMLIAGSALVWTGQAGVLNSIDASLRQRVSDLTTHATTATTAVFAQAQPLLEALRDHLRDQRARDPAHFAATVGLLMRHRPGVRYLSFSGTDGSFLGVYTDGDDGEVLRLNHSWLEADGTTTKRISDIASDGSLTTVEVARQTGYDPRTRPFYAPAVAHATAIWTAPYPFYQSQLGITCALAVRDPRDASLLGVATVDFDFTSLGEVMRHLSGQGPEGSTVFLFTKDREVLATSGNAADAQQRFTCAQMMMSAMSTPIGSGQLSFFHLPVPGQPLLLGVRGVSPPGGPLWFAATGVPRNAISAEFDGQLRDTWWIGLTSLAVAVSLSLVLANHLSRQRRIASAARVAEHSARRKLQEMGSYTLIRELGHGGMGTVWMAQHQLLARTAALKLILPEAFGRDGTEREEARRRFEREAKATASLHSRNTVTLYDYGVADGGSFYYAMELLDGLDLERLVRSFGPQPPGRVIQILIQVCNSLAEAHARGMVHRDIKPANIQLCRLGIEVDVVKVLDFGLVAVRSTGDIKLTRVGRITGTPGFMAPEQAQDQACDGRTDLYALGCVAYWLLAGRPVFVHDDAMSMLIDHIQAPPQPLAQVADQPIAAQLQAVVMGLLAKDPAQRPADALAVIVLLRAIVLPPGQEWTPWQAESWWETHRPVSKPRSDDRQG